MANSENTCVEVVPVGLLAVGVVTTNALPTVHVTASIVMTANTAVVHVDLLFIMVIMILCSTRYRRPGLLLVWGCVVSRRVEASGDERCVYVCECVWTNRRTNTNGIPMTRKMAKKPNLGRHSQTAVKHTAIRLDHGDTDRRNMVLEWWKTTTHTHTHTHTLVADPSASRQCVMGGVRLEKIGTHHTSNYRARHRSFIHSFIEPTVSCLIDGTIGKLKNQP